MTNLIGPKKVGAWSQIKHGILKEYAQQYANILSKQRLKYYYIDAYAGEGKSVLKTTDKIVHGSPLVVMDIKPEFNGYCFIDADPNCIQTLRSNTAGNRKVQIIEGRANEVLYERILPQLEWKSYRRALLFLDPYNLDVEWRVIERAGKNGTVDFFLNFMTMDLNMNILKRDPDKVRPDQIERFNRIFGDESWQKAAWNYNTNLFDDQYAVKNNTMKIVNLYWERLKLIAGYKFVPEPIPVHNSKGFVIYHLFFGSQKDSANSIASWVMKNYKNYRVNDV